MDAKTQKLYEMKAEVLAAAGQPIRLAILEVLRDGEVCVCEIAERVGAQRPNVSRHLGVMRKAGLVSQRKEGLRVMYSLRTPCVLNFLDCVTRVLLARAEETRDVLKAL